MQRTGTIAESTVAAGRRRRNRSPASAVAWRCGLVLATSPAPSARTAHPGRPQAAAYGAAWLAAQLDQQIPMINFGCPDWGVTLDAGLSLAATGSGGEQLDAVWAALVADRDAARGTGDRRRLAGPAGPRDPAGRGHRRGPPCGRRDPGADLVARLVAPPAGPMVPTRGSSVSRTPPMTACSGRATRSLRSCRQACRPTRPRSSGCSHSSAAPSPTRAPGCPTGPTSGALRRRSRAVRRAGHQRDRRRHHWTRRRQRG